MLKGKISVKIEDNNSSRAYLPSTFLKHHYERLIPKVEQLLRRKGENIRGLYEGADVLNAVYLILTDQERRGVAATEDVGTDVDKMTSYVMGKAGTWIDILNTQQGQFTELKTNLSAILGEDVIDKYFEEDKAGIHRECMAEFHELLMSWGIDIETLKRMVSDKSFERACEKLKAEPIAVFNVLMDVTFVTEEEEKHLRHLLSELERTKE